jgi:antitoxin component YwqK of YwqJK toxin-antitoxin module
MKKSLHWLLSAVLVFSCSTRTHEFVEESYPDGTPKVVRHYKHENKEGLLKEIQYYNDSSVYIEGSYKDGERDGVWTAWFRNGKVWSTGEYRNGKESGKKTVYYENGQKYYEGMVEDEKRIGKWTFWDEEGNMLKTIDYDKSP